MRTAITALVAIVIILIAIVAVYGATDSILDLGLTELDAFSDGILGCLGGEECDLLENGDS